MCIYISSLSDMLYKKYIHKVTMYSQKSCNVLAIHSLRMSTSFPNSIDIKIFWVFVCVLFGLIFSCLARVHHRVAVVKHWMSVF